MILAYDLLEDRCTIDVITTKLFPLCFKMAESFENLDNILRDWANDMYKKKIVDALNRYEKHSLAGRRKIKPFLLENGSEKNTRAVGRKRDLSQTQNWSSVTRKPLLYLEFNKPNKQNVYEIIHLINLAFLSLKLIVDTLIVVGNCKTANIKINT